MRNSILAALAVGLAVAYACNSEDPNDGDNFLDFIPAPNELICQDVDCTSDDDCVGTSTTARFCAPQIGECVQCADDNDCLTLAQTSTVFTFRLNCRGFTCQCSDDQACLDGGLGLEGEGPFCVPEAGICAECGRDGDCAAPTPACVAAGTPDAFCGCGSDADCAGDEQCISGECLCAADTACPSETPRCDVERGECFECDTNEDCAEPTPTCAGRICVECVSNDDCDEDATEACQDNACVVVACLDDDDCGEDQFCGTDDDDNPACEDAACTSDADCAGNPDGTFCLNADDPASAECTCSDDSHCTTAGRTRCYFPDNSGRYCGCADDADCQAGGAGDRCIQGDFNRLNASGCVCDDATNCGGGACRTPI